MDSQTQTSKKTAKTRKGRRTRPRTNVREKNSKKLTNQTNNKDVKEEKTFMRKKKSRFFETYINKTLKRIAPNNGITANARQQLNSATYFLAVYLANVISRLTIISKKKTMSDREVSNATRLVLPLTLANDSLEKAQSSVEKFNDDSTDKTKHTSRQEKAGIIFPPSIAEKFLRNFDMSKIMVTKNAPVFLACVLEHVVTTLLQYSSELTKSANRVRITIRELELSVQENPDLQQLWDTCNLSFVGGGVVPQIHESLLVKKPRKKKKKVDGDKKKTHRFRPGTVSIREIKKLQKVSNSLTLAKFPFERSVRSIVKTYRDNMKISKDVFIILQYYIEQAVIDFLRDANNAAIHANRVKLMASDLLFIHKLRGNSPLDINLYGKQKKVKEDTKEDTKEESELDDSDSDEE